MGTLTLWQQWNSAGLFTITMILHITHIYNLYYNIIIHIILYYIYIYIDHEQFFGVNFQRNRTVASPNPVSKFQTANHPLLHVKLGSLQGRQDLDFDLRVLGAGHHLRSSGNWLIILQNLMVYHHVPIFSYIFLITIGIVLDQISIISSRDRPCRPPGKRPGRRASSPSKANFC